METRRDRLEREAQATRVVDMSKAPKHCCPQNCCCLKLIYCRTTNKELKVEGW